MKYKIENLSSQQLLILLNNNSLIPLQPRGIVDAIPAEEISNNFVIDRLAKWGLISILKTDTANLPALA